MFKKYITAFGSGLVNLGKALMLPIAVLPVAGLILRLGQPDLLNIAFMAEAGQAIFSNLPLIKHFHVAGLYERDEALFGPNYNYEPLLRRIAAEVPDLYVGAEFFPGDAEKGTQAIKTIMGY